jgi:uncharacterized repeat protein (TIGR03803 family)
MKTRLKNLSPLVLTITALASLLPREVTPQTFTTLYTFTGVSDGETPAAGLLLSGGTLYGTAQSGGSSGGGTIFRLNTDGTGFALLHTFTEGSDGAYPWAG